MASRLPQPALTRHAPVAGPSRRTVLRAAGLAGLGAAAPTLVGAADPDAASAVDCVVIGAGLSGLAAAADLVAAGRSVVVLEARARAGGRVHSITSSAGHAVDAGAEFVGPTQDAMLGLAQRYGVALSATYNEGFSQAWHRGLRTWYAAPMGMPLSLGTLTAAPTLLALNSYAAQIPVGRPWEHPRAAEWDSITFEQWIDRNVQLTSEGRMLIGLICSSALSIEPSAVSALFMFHYIAAAGGPGRVGTVERLLNVKDGAQQWYAPAGMASIPLAMAAELAPVIRYEAPVASVVHEQGADGPVAVVTHARGTVRARRVICAMSPVMAGQIDWQPGVSASRAALHSGTRMGSIGKFFATYAAPFWRSAGQSGQVIGDGTPTDVTFESASHGVHHLMGFISAAQMRRLDAVAEEQVRAESLDAFERYFGRRARTDVLGTACFRWDLERWSQGGPTGVLGPGLLTRHGRALAEPDGLVHWAGTESAGYWTGYMEGAVTSGRRAAGEVHAALPA